MKKWMILLMIVSSSVLFALAPPAIPHPVATVSIESYEALSKAVTGIVDAVVPGKGEMVIGQLPASLGIPLMAGISKNKPIHIVVGFIGKEVPPVVAFFIPVDDFEGFKKGMLPGSIFRQTPAGQNHVGNDGDYAVIVMNDTKNGVSTIQKDYIEAAENWIVNLDKPGHLIQIDWKVAAVRSGLLDKLREGRAQVLQGLPMGMAQPGMGPADLNAIMNEYFNILESAVRSTEKLNMTLDYSGKGLEVKTVMTPVKGSDLEKNLAAPDFALADISGWLNPSEQMSFIGGMKKDNPMSGMLEKLMGISFKAQGFDPETSEQLKKQSLEFFNLMSPSLLAATSKISMTGLSQKAVYKLDAERAGKMLDSMKAMMDIMKSQAGPDKMLSEISYTPEFRKAGSVRVDRLIMKFNLMNPALAQQAMVLQMLKMDKFVYEYAAVDDLLVYGTPDGFDDYLTAVKKDPAQGVLNKNCVLKGNLNFISIAKEFSPMMVIMLPQVAAVFGGIDTAGCNIELEVMTDNNLQAVLSVPITLFKTIGKIVQALNRNNQPGAPVPQAPRPQPVPEL